MKSSKNFGHWLNHDGKRVEIEGRPYVLKVRQTRVKYPCGVQVMVTVFAAPVWPADLAIDVLGSDAELIESVLGQAQFHGDLSAVPYGC